MIDVVHSISDIINSILAILASIIAIAPVVKRRWDKAKSKKIETTPNVTASCPIGNSKESRYGSFFMSDMGAILLLFSLANLLFMPFFTANNADLTLGNLCSVAVASCGVIVGYMAVNK
ncbi:MAG: hypothetical protein B6I36_02420 [Desulfobacteraceae bacterium 4572_35.1]|nr:MAG: hypothetical protein B6I36_02420 [Desulfobacteraceae bacterium 4572_35.1]